MLQRNAPEEVDNSHNDGVEERYQTQLYIAQSLAHILQALPDLPASILTVQGIALTSLYNHVATRLTTFKPALTPSYTSTTALLR